MNGIGECVHGVVVSINDCHHCTQRYNLEKKPETIKRFRTDALFSSVVRSLVILFEEHKYKEQDLRDAEYMATWVISDRTRRSRT